MKASAALKLRPEDIYRKQLMAQEAVRPFVERICELHIMFDQHKIMISKDGSIEHETTLPADIQSKVDILTQQVNDIARIIRESSPTSIP